MTSTALATVETLSPRQEAARRAWVTIRARKAALAGGITVLPPARTPARSAALAESALAAFDKAAAGDFDWHAAALALRGALLANKRTPMRARGQAIIPRADAQTRAHAPPLAITAPVLADYLLSPGRAVNSRLIWPSPILVVTFADGEVIRAPAVSLKGHAVNVGRGLRIAVIFYQCRLARRLGFVGAQSIRGRYPNAPAITSCQCETTGEEYNAELCTERTVRDRAAGDTWPTFACGQIRAYRRLAYLRLRRNCPTDMPAERAKAIIERIIP